MRKTPAYATPALPATSQRLVRLGNDCLVVILSFLVVSVGPNDFSKLLRWISIQCVCKQLYEVCHSPQLMGLLNVRVGSLEVLQKLSRAQGVQRLSCVIVTESNKWCELLPKFTSLQELTLLRDVTDELEYVALCTTLKSLSLSPYGTASRLQICSTLTSLEALRLSEHITDHSLSTVALFANLHDLDISRCSQVSDEGLKVLSHLRLRTLDVSSTSISDVGLCGLRLDRMEKLTIYNSCITDACFSHLGSVLSLQVGFKCLNGTAALVALTSLTELVVLDILKNTNEFFRDLSMLTNLRRLEVECMDCDLHSLRLPKLQSLSLTVFGDGEVRHLGTLSGLGPLESLSFHTMRRVLGADLDELSLLTGLKELDLSRNSYAMTDTVLRNISCLKSLRSLNISGCPKLRDASLHWIEQLPQLEVLEFAGTCMSKATVMERLPNIEWIMIY